MLYQLKKKLFLCLTLIVQNFIFVFFRAILLAWVAIVTSAIPVALSHGVVNYPYRDHNYTACVFRSDLNYNLIAFQVSFIYFWYLICVLYFYPYFFVTFY